MIENLACGEALLFFFFGGDNGDEAVVVDSDTRFYLVLISCFT